MAGYNLWYSATYEPIFEMANWDDFALDIEKKFVCVFAWMPQTIMSILHSRQGSNRVTKAMVYGDDRVREEFQQVESVASLFKGQSLLDIDLEDREVQDRVLDLCDPIFKVLGSVGGSKYLHFSFPDLFPMWDRKLRKEKRCPDSPFGYLRYLGIVKRALSDETTFQNAQKEYPSNVVRGLDIMWMKEIRK